MTKHNANYDPNGEAEDRSSNHEEVWLLEVFLNPTSDEDAKCQLPCGGEVEVITNKPCQKAKDGQS